MEKKLPKELTFNTQEKLAVVKMIDYVILADSKVAHAEMDLLTELMQHMSFDSFFVGRARNLNKDLALLIIKNMSIEKKKALANLLEEAAKVDGFVHEKEISFIIAILNHMGISKPTHLS